jgi:hypothetical protein
VSGRSPASQSRSSLPRGASTWMPAPPAITR